MRRKRQTKKSMTATGAKPIGRGGFGLYLKGEHVTMLNELKARYEENFAAGGIEVKIPLTSIVRGAIQQAWTKEMGFSEPGRKPGRKKAT